MSAISLLAKGWRALAIVGVAAIVLTSGGCTRGRYYKQADKEVAYLLMEKADDPRWPLPTDYTVRMDPRSRFYDVYSQVHPPMPPDDPASHRFMHLVDGKRGYRGWHRHGDRPDLENPAWRNHLCEYVPVDEEGRVKLTLASAMRLARINSSDYQEQFETLYLSALDVSTERFRFDVQFFGSYDPAYTHQGYLRRGNNGREQNMLALDGAVRAQRRFATAGELLVGFANSMVWQFAGPDSFSNVSLLNFNLVQPLLRGAGRDVALEQLTIAERTLLANLRALQRYRQGFYVRVAYGDTNVAGPQRRGGFFGGTGITGFTGTGAGGLGGVGSATGFGRAGFGAQAGGGTGGSGAGFAGGGAGQVGGFYGLLQQLQQTRNSQQNLNLQLRTLGLLEAYEEAGTIDPQQVDQFRQNIETARASLLQAQDAFQTALESYKTSVLNLPPDLPMEVDDSEIRQFQLIQPAISGLQDNLNEFCRRFGAQPKEPPLTVLREALTELAKLHEEAVAQFPAVGEDLARVKERSALRQQEMSARERAKFAADCERLADQYEKLGKRLAETAAALRNLEQFAGEENRRQTADAVVVHAMQLSNIVDEMTLVQARARTETITIQHEELTPEEALDIARANRLDWMNNRAQLVDTWRLIQFNADALRSGLRVTFSGDMSTTGNSPMRFRAPTGQLRVGLQFDAPFARLLERNNFRQAIIDYQRDRRRLIQFEDNVYQTLRQELRDLEQLRRNLDIQRRAVAIAVRRVDQTREELNKPPPTPEPGKEAAQLGPTAALNLLTALNDLSSSQNNLMSVWLNYQATRARLARDLGVLQLDEEGMWLPQPFSAAERATAEELPLPPAVPEEWLQPGDAADPPPGDALGELRSQGELPPEPSPPPTEALPRTAILPSAGRRASGQRVAHRRRRTVE